MTIAYALLFVLIVSMLIFILAPGISLPEIHFRIVCTKGTYIRSLARDLGELLGVGAYLSALTRTRIGKYRLEDADNLTELIEKIKAGLHENL